MTLTKNQANDEANGVPSKLPQRPSGWGQRHTIVVLGFLGFSVSYAMRFNLSLAIVAMVNSTKVPQMQMSDSAGHFFSNSTILPVHTCPDLKLAADASKNASGKISEATGEFNWNEAEQGVILGSFFWGYVLTQIPGGIISQKYGGKWPLGLGLLVTAIFAILTPMAARIDKSCLIVVRVIQGLAEGVTTPAMHVILANWAPPAERSTLASIAYAGAQFGTAATMIGSGALIHSNIFGGWPAVFYVMGGVSIIWFILWTFLMYDSPEEDPRISKEELNYIQQSIGNQTSKVRIPTPWLKIMTSIPVWAILIGHVGHAWGLYTLLTELPTYMKSVLHFDIKQNSWMSALPYIVMWILSILLTRGADLLISKKIFRVIVVRKLCQITAHWGSAIALVAASYSGCDRTLTVALLTIAVGVNGAIYGGYVVNHVDIAPNHAGILMGITNTFANLCGFGAPYVAGLIINENPSLGQWQLVFFIAAGIYFVEALIYALLASTEEQDWNRGEVYYAEAITYDKSHNSVSLGASRKLGTKI